jgi:hypothetical protein
MCSFTDSEVDSSSIFQFIPCFTFAATPSLGFSMRHHEMKFKPKRESWQAYNVL